MLEDARGDVGPADRAEVDGVVVLFEIGDFVVSDDDFVFEVTRAAVGQGGGVVGEAELPRDFFDGAEALCGDFGANAVAGDECDPEHDGGSFFAWMRPPSGAVGRNRLQGRGE